MKLYDDKGKYNRSGARIRQARKAKGLSQRQLVTKLQLLGLEVTQKTISRMEAGERVLPADEPPFYAQAPETAILWLPKEKPQRSRNGVFFHCKAGFR